MVSQGCTVYPAQRLSPGFRSLRPPVTRLYVSGSVPPQNCKRVTVVGTRTASRSGLQAAFEIARTLAQAGVVVVSGMARGVDTAAHEGALSGGGRTVAFIGSGLDRISSRHARLLAERITQEGAVISEYPPDRPAQAYTFVARNRLLAAYSIGVVVVEAGEKSGALITADFALDAGKSIWAVPGDVTRPNTRGSNRLIQDGALVALNGLDILVGLGLTRVDECEFEIPPPPHLTDTQARIFQVLSREGCLDLESLHGFTSLPVAALLAAVSELEVQGCLARSPEGISLKK